MAKNDIATGSLQLDADSSKLDAKLQATSKKIAAWNVQLGKNISFITSNPAFAIGRQILDSFKGIDDINDSVSNLAKIVGLTVEEMSGLRGVAMVADTSIEDLSKAFKNLSMITGNLGTDEAQKSLEALGLTVADIAGKGSLDQFMKIADALNGISDPSQRAALAFKTLGKSAGAVDPLVQLGSAGIRDEMERMKKLGVTYKDGSGIDKAGEALKRFDLAVEGITRSLAMALAPAVEALATVMANTIGKLTEGENTTPGNESWGHWFNRHVEGGLAAVDDYSKMLYNPSEAWNNPFGTTKEIVKMHNEEFRRNAMKQLEEAKKRDPAYIANLKFEEYMSNLRASGDKTGELKLRGMGFNDIQIATALGQQRTNKVNDVTDKLKEANATIGMTADAAERWKLAQEGVSKSILDGIANLQKSNELLKAGESILQRKGGYDTMAQQLQGLAALSKNGKASNRNVLLSLGAFVQQHQGIAGMGGLPSTMLAGSTEAARAIIGNQRQTPLIDIKMILEATKRTQDQTLQVGKDNLKAFQDFAANGGI